MNCVDDRIDRTQKIVNKRDGSKAVVFVISRKKKCSNDIEALKEEENVIAPHGDKTNRVVPATDTIKKIKQIEKTMPLEEDEISTEDKEDNSCGCEGRDEEMEIIKETFSRFLGKTKTQIEETNKQT